MLSLEMALYTPSDDPLDIARLSDELRTENWHVYSKLKSLGESEEAPLAGARSETLIDRVRLLAEKKNLEELQALTGEVEIVFCLLSALGRAQLDPRLLEVLPRVRLAYVVSIPIRANPSAWEFMNRVARAIARIMGGVLEDRQTGEWSEAEGRELRPLVRIPAPAVPRPLKEFYDQLRSAGCPVDSRHGAFRIDVRSLGLGDIERLLAIAEAKLPTEWFAAVGEMILEDFKNAKGRAFVRDHDAWFDQLRRRFPS